MNKTERKYSIKAAISLIAKSLLTVPVAVFVASIIWGSVFWMSGELVSKQQGMHNVPIIGREFYSFVSVYVFLNFYFSSFSMAVYGIGTIALQAFSYDRVWGFVLFAALVWVVNILIRWESDWELLGMAFWLINGVLVGALHWLLIKKIFAASTRTAYEVQEKNNDA